MKKIIKFTQCVNCCNKKKEQTGKKLKKHRKTDCTKNQFQIKLVKDTDLTLSEKEK